MALVWVLATVCLCVFHEINADRAIDKIIEEAGEKGRMAGNIIPEDSILVELDMLFKKDEWAEIQQSMSRGDGGRFKRKAIRADRYRWPDNTVPYEYQPDIFSNEDIEQIELAIEGWNEYSCLNLRPRTPEDVNYVYVSGEGFACMSPVGMSGGQNTLSLGDGCRRVDVVLHEFGHSIGLFHEHSRHDRDEWVDVVESSNNNLVRYPESENNEYGILYDYRSIMHYSLMAMSTNHQPTIVPRDPYFIPVIGHAEYLSFRDIKVVNEMYSCNSHCPPQQCPGEGFVGKDCKCWCPGNPVQICGDSNPEVPLWECKDSWDTCPQHAADGDCETIPGWILDACQLSCGLCEAGDTCVDYDGNCDYYSHNGWCDSNREYMADNCPMSCRICRP